MPKPIAFLGGLLAIIGVVVSLFSPAFAWVSMNLLKDPLIGESENFLINFNAFNGYTNSDNGDNVLFAVQLAFLLPAIVILVGSIMSFTGKKEIVLIGGSLILLGILFWMADFEIVAANYFSGLGYSGLSIPLKEIFSGSQQWDYVITVHILSWKLALGFYVTAAGGLLSMIGAFIGKDY